MTEDEWASATRPHLLLDFLWRRGHHRRLRLFAVACCRRIWHVLPDEESRRAVEVAERFADGQSTEAELLAALEAADAVGEERAGRALDGQLHVNARAVDAGLAALATSGWADCYGDQDGPRKVAM